MCSLFAPSILVWFFLHGLKSGRKIGLHSIHGCFLCRGLWERDRRVFGISFSIFSFHTSNLVLLEGAGRRLCGVVVYPAFGSRLWAWLWCTALFSGAALSSRACAIASTQLPNKQENCRLNCSRFPVGLMLP